MTASHRPTEPTGSVIDIVDNVDANVDVDIDVDIVDRKRPNFDN